ncbi:MAG: hypothetical protein AAFY41_00630 [Bacteroidota bacterium]
MGQQRHKVTNSLPTSSRLLSYASNKGIVSKLAIESMSINKKWDSLMIVLDTKSFEIVAREIVYRTSMMSHNPLPSAYDPVNICLLCALFPMYSFNSNTCKDINNAHVQSIWVILDQISASYMYREDAKLLMDGRSARGFRKLFPKTHDRHNIRTSRHSKQQLAMRARSLSKNIVGKLSDFIEVGEITSFDGTSKVFT